MNCSISINGCFDFKIITKTKKHENNSSWAHPIPNLWLFGKQWRRGMHVKQKIRMRDILLDLAQLFIRPTGLTTWVTLLTIKTFHNLARWWPRTSDLCISDNTQKHLWCHQSHQVWYKVTLCEFNCTEAALVIEGALEDLTLWCQTITVYSTSGSLALSLYCCLLAWWHLQVLRLVAPSRTWTCQHWLLWLAVLIARWMQRFISNMILDSKINVDGIPRK